MTNMSPRERILRAMRRQKPDRVPREAGFTQPLYATFVQQTAQSDPALHFGMDRRTIEFLPPMPPADFSPEGHGIFDRYLPAVHRDGQVDEWGNLLVRGFKYDTTDYVFPMRDLRTVAELAAFPFPDFTQEACHAHFESAVKAYQGQGYAVTGSLWGTMFERTWHMRGMDNLFADFHDNPEFATALLDRMMELRVFQAARYAMAGVDILHIGDDIGMQDRIMMSLPTWRRWFKPRLSAVIQAARHVKPDLVVEYHSDGYIEPFIPELIEIGIDVLNPVQPECMDPAEIKRKYGDRLAFSGTVGTQTTMPFGTVQEVRETVRLRIETVGKDGGLIIAPTHTLEPDVPWENVLALFDAAEEFGQYQ
jgi:uroporphyrinogen decarboxylase